MLIDLREMLALAEQKRFAVPAFNVYNMETVMGVTAAAESCRAPVILQCYSRLFSGEEGAYLAPVILAAAHKADVPVCFHLDHGASECETTRALRYGCTGMMIDGSLLPFAENAVLTSRVAQTAAHVGVPIEGELGHIGSVNDDCMDAFTDPEEAARFAEQTGIAALAVLVGTAHGRYRQSPKLDIPRIAAIREATGGLPLVLHGGSGVPDEQIRAAVQAGIRKVNFGTDLCYAFLEKVLATPLEQVAVDLFMRDAVDSVRAFAAEKMQLLGAQDKA